MNKGQLIELREDVINGKIEAEKACEILFSNKTKSWHTKEW